MRWLSAVLIILGVVGGAESVHGQWSYAADSIGLVLPNMYEKYDRPIDPDLYLIRPGDELRVTFVKAKLAELKLDIDPEGRVVHPTLGVYGLGGMSFSQARLLLLPELENLYKADDIVLSVGDPRPVVITVAGAVADPGSFVGFTSQRVSDIIDMAGGILPTGSRRHIVFRGGPEDVAVDLDRAFAVGDASADPCLYVGEYVFVPGRSPMIVHVVGEVNQPRDIELLPEDDLDVLLAIAGGLRGSADRSAIQIIGETSGQSPIEAGNVILVPVSEKPSAQSQVTVYGFVSKPGAYTFREDMTLEDLIREAGGFTAEANAASTRVFRLAAADRLGRRSIHRYPIVPTAEPAGGMRSPRLVASDSVFVPRRIGCVRIRGEVLNPGFYAYVEGKSAAFYVDAAGGFLPRADRERVGLFDRVSGITGTYSPGVEVHDGDEVIVSIREELR